jgi:hypothetical protein
LGKGVTGEVVEERDGGGAADDGVDPEPPGRAEDGAGNTRTYGCPHRWEIVVIHRAAR